jgi:hypothetical protein
MVLRPRRRAQPFKNPTCRRESAARGRGGARSDEASVTDQLVAQPPQPGRGNSRVKSSQALPETLDQSYQHHRHPFNADVPGTSAMREECDLPA